MSVRSTAGVQSFENDVFISYAHEDNKPVPPDEQGWVDYFEKALKARLAKIAGDPPRIWRDPTLERSGNLDEHIRNHLRASALLLCVISRSYVRSTSCREELNQFLNDCHDDKRIVKVVTESLPDHKEHPPPLDKSLGFEFFWKDESTQRAYPLEPDDDQLKSLYKRRLFELACALANHLASIKGEVAVREPVATVYLARSSFDLNEQREALRSELEHHGVRVLPDAPLASLATACETQVQAWLDQCTTSIHLIGRYGGGAPDGERDESYVELQHRLAVSHSLTRNPNLTRLLWMVPEPAPEDRDHVRFVRHLMDDPATYDSGDLIQGSFEEFKAAVIGRSVVKSKPPAPRCRPVRAYLIYNPGDEDAIVPIDNALANLGVEVRLPVFEGEEGARARDHAVAIRNTDWAIVYWGDGGELWFNDVVEQLRNWEALGRKAEIRIAVCLAPPSSRRKERCLSQPRPEVLISFLNGASEDALRELSIAFGGG